MFRSGLHRNTVCCCCYLEFTGIGNLALCFWSTCDETAVRFTLFMTNSSSVNCWASAWPVPYVFPFMFTTSFFVRCHLVAALYVSYLHWPSAGCSPHDHEMPTRKTVSPSAQPKPGHLILWLENKIVSTADGIYTNNLECVCQFVLTWVYFVPKKNI